MGLQINQLVICISDDFIGHLHEGVSRPIRGKIYTIRDIVWSEYYQQEHLLFHECRNREYEYASGIHEPSWGSYRFRPLDDTKIEIFRAMLVSPPKETADA